MKMSSLPAPNTRPSPEWQIIDEVPQRIANILNEGNPVAWFQGRMEFGPRALGGRSILGCPSIKALPTASTNKDQVPRTLAPLLPEHDRYRRPEDARQRRHPPPYMTFTFKVSEEWKSRVPEVVLKTAPRAPRFSNAATIRATTT